MKNQIKKTVNFLFTLLVFSSLISSCKKDDDGGSNPFPPSGNTLKTSVLGTIKDTDGLIVSGAIVKLGTYTTTTDVRGNFQFINADVPKDRMVIVASKTGFFDCVRAKRTQSGEANYINLLMEEKPAAVNIAGVAGGVVNIPGGAKITFPANAFVDAAGNAYTGTVKVFARHISPGDDNFEAIVPGGDLSGINLAGQAQSLYSLGMIEAILTDNTGLTEVKLASGKSAELKFPIDPSQMSSAQSTIPMWHMDETTGVWREEGEATKTGNLFVGNVSHFSTWNCDYSGIRTDIQGKVVDCQNNPMPGIVVTINGFMNVTTDNSGAFTAWVPKGYVIDCQVLKIFNSSLPNDSPIQTITAIGGILNIVPPLTIACLSRISGAIFVCASTTLSPGTVYASWNGGNKLIYTSSGVYSMFVPQNTSINLTAYSMNLNGNNSVQSGNGTDTTYVPSIQLCNTQLFSQTKFTTTDTTGITISYSMSNIVSNTMFTDQNLDGIFESADLSFNGTINPGNRSCAMNISFATSSQINGYYILDFIALGPNFMTLQIDSINSINYYSGSNTGPTLTDNKLIITDYGAPGGIISGRFSFDSSQGAVTNGEFSVTRNN